MERPANGSVNSRPAEIAPQYGIVDPFSADGQNKQSRENPEKILGAQYEEDHPTQSAEGESEGAFLATPARHYLKLIARIRLEQSSSDSSSVIQPPQWRQARIATPSVQTSFNAGRRARAEENEITLRANLAEASCD